MNLSHRLDQARAKRAQMGDEDPDPLTSFDLRMKRDASIYDGRDLRTGEPMSEERWQERRADPAKASLPRWDPQRANDLVTADLTLDVTGRPGDEVVDLRAQRDTEADGDDDDAVFEMPAWARDAEVFRSDHE